METAGFGHSMVLGPMFIGLALIVAFVFHALRTPHALIDLRLFKNRTFAVAAGTLTLMIISVFGAMLLLPLLLLLPQAARLRMATATTVVLRSTPALSTQVLLGLSSRRARMTCRRPSRIGERR